MTVVSEPVLFLCWSLPCVGIGCVVNVVGPCWLVVVLLGKNVGVLVDVVVLVWFPKVGVLVVWDPWEVSSWPPPSVPLAPGLWPLVSSCLSPWTIQVSPQSCHFYHIW